MIVDIEYRVYVTDVFVAGAVKVYIQIGPVFYSGLHWYKKSWRPGTTGLEPRWMVRASWQ